MHSITWILFCLSLLVSCGKENQPAPLPEQFIESFTQQKPSLLHPYFPTAEFHKSLERNPAGQPDSVAMNFVNESNRKITESWTRIAERIRAGNIDLSKAKVVETILAQPFWTKKISRMVVVYNYENRNWDDLVLIVGHSGDSTFLLEIPEPDLVFSMKDTTLQASRNARFETEIRTPEFKKTLQDKVDTLTRYAKENRMQEFASMIYVPEPDPGNTGMDTLTRADLRKQIGSELMERIRAVSAGCGEAAWGDVNAMDLEEGKWIILQQKCSTAFVHYAFIRVNGQLLLSDVDAAGIK